MMRFPSKEIVERVRKEYPVGTRVELVKMDDAYAPPIGTKGTVRGVDDTATIMVRWDTGSGLGVVYGEDVCKVVHESPIRFDTSDWASMIKIMDDFGQSQGIPSGENENGETVLMDITNKRIHVTTFQKNGWIRENTYWRDCTCEETFSGKTEV